MNTTIRRRPLRRAVDSTAAVALAALLYPAIAWAYRDERRKAGAR